MKTRHQSAALLALLWLPMLAKAQAEVNFSTLVASQTTLTHPVAVQGSRQINNGFIDADYFGSASLIDGTLRAKVSATPLIVFTASPGAQSDAQVRDRLKVFGPGTSPVPLQLRMDIDALMTVPAVLGPSAANSLWIVAQMTVDGGAGMQSSMEIQRFKSTTDAGVVNEDFIQCWGQPCDLNQPLTLAGIVDGQITLNVMLTPGFFYPFSARLQVNTSSTPGVPGQVDASQTARLSYTLPAGYTLGSQSGVFLSAVPEPQTWALWAAGLLALAGRRPRARRGRAQD
jgi:hypothetical protein